MSRVFTLLLLCAVFSCYGSATAATVDGAEIHWESDGNGPAIVFIHGNRRDTTDWRYQVAEFEDDYRVITLDLPGHGQSGALSEVIDSSIFWGGSVIPLAEAIEAVRAEAGIDRMVLVGHSLGGWVIGEYMMHYPQYVSAVVAADVEFHGPRRGGRGPQFEKTITHDDLIEVPALLVWADGEGGMLQRGIAPEDMLPLYPSGRVEVMRGVSHNVMLDDPEEFNRLLREFLREIGY